MPRKSRAAVQEEQLAEQLPEVVEYPIIPTPPVEKKPKKSPHFIVSSDLHEIIEIMKKVDGVSGEQVADKLNLLIAKGELVVAPSIGFGLRKKS